jgi:hypothetical protein
MRRRSFWLAIGTLILMVACTGSALAVLVRHTPAFYERCGLPPGPEREKLSGEFFAEFTNRLLGGVLDKRQWDARFTEQQINSYFEEDFIKKHNAENPLPPGISEPRVALEKDRIRLGFRYGTGLRSSIVNVDVRPWLVAREPNVVALEIESLHAGALPISSQWLLEVITEMARRPHIEVTWYRYRSHPVLLLRFQAQRTTPTFQLCQLSIQEGLFVIVGRSLDTTPKLEAITGQ